jgi:hypothetical protein
MYVIGEITNTNNSNTVARRLFIFQLFLDIATANLSTLLASLVPLIEGGGELFSGDSSSDPFPLCLEGVLVQEDTRHLVIHAPKQEEVCWHHVQRIGWVAGDLETVGGQPILNNGSGVNRGVMPVEIPPLPHQDRPLLLHVLREDAQDLQNVHQVDGGPPGDNV